MLANYAFVKLTDCERAACESAYRYAMKLTHRKAKALYAADRAVFIEAQTARRERQKAQVQRCAS